MLAAAGRVPAVRRSPSAGSPRQEDASSNGTMGEQDDRAGTRELLNWILGLGPHVRVVAPEELRAEVARSLDAAGRLYA